jgi:quercetin dioxygenase-like cupin family protein
MSPYKVDFEQVAWEHPAPNVRHKVYQEGHRRLRLVEFSKGFVEADWCTRAHSGYVLEGEMNVDFHGTVVRYRAGDGVFIPAGEDCGHKATVLSDVVRLVLVEEV